MAAVPFILQGTMGGKNVTFTGTAFYTDLEIGGGPILPGQPPGTPEHPIYIPPGRPEHPIVPPGGYPGPEHPIVVPPPPDAPDPPEGPTVPPIPPDPPVAPPGNDVPDGWSWVYTETEGWLLVYNPGGGGKPRPPGGGGQPEVPPDPNAPHVDPRGRRR